MDHYVGIDFGTTNSAIAIARPGGEPELSPFQVPGGDSRPTCRTVLYFEPDDDSAEGPSAGEPAIRRFIENEGDGRLIQSIKSYLASALFSKTQILGRQWSLEQLIGAFLHRVRQDVSHELGTRAVVGRPVRYWGATNEEDDARAVRRMRQALALAGFDDVQFQYEPVAAAALYASRLDSDELVLIADFGGGTSDFSLIRVGPDLPPGSEGAILGTGGIGVGGDTFDGRIVDRAIAPLLGKGTLFRDEFAAEMPVPAWLFNRLRRWHHLSFLKSKKTMALLERIQLGAMEPARIQNLVHLVDHDLGLPLHQSIEAAKVELSAIEETTLRFSHAPLALSVWLERLKFSEWIRPDLDEVSQVVDQLLDHAGVTPGEVDRVFTTGGSSFVPAVKADLARRFGAERLVGGGELTSVAWGLAAHARTQFSS